MTYFHGTSYENAENIKTNGFCPKQKIWSVSHPDKTYIVKDNPEYPEESLQFAFDAAVTAAAELNSQSTSVCIFKMDANEYAEEFIEPDSSCANMYNCYQIDTKKLNELVKQKHIRLSIGYAEGAYNKHLRALYLISTNTDNLNMSSLDYLLRKTILQLKNADSGYFDAIYDILYPGYPEWDEMITETVIL